MPMARISLLNGHPSSWVQALSRQVHSALVDAFEVPPDDCFQAIHQHAPGELVYDRHYLGGPRTDDFVLIAISAGRPRSRATKQAFYRCLVERLAEAPGINAEDVMVIIQTSDADDWSFGGGRLGVTSQETTP